ncbi:MAG: hypothetical protein QNI88_16190 [Desulfobacterales bacterium]|nr:hypothetical protein [Desulfobacterales bacterium]
MAIFSVDQLFIFFHVEDEPKEDALAPLFLRVAKPANEAAPHAAMRRCQVRSGAHNLTIAARLTPLGALPDSMMLASWPGFGFGPRKLASLKQVRGLFPAASAMLGAGQRGIETTAAPFSYADPFWHPALHILLYLFRLIASRRLTLARLRGD